MSQHAGRRVCYQTKEWKTLQLISLLTIALWGVSQAKSVLIPLCLAALLAFLLTPILRFLKRHRLPESLSIIFAAAVVVIPLAAIAYEALVQGEALIKELPALVKTLKKEWDLAVSSSWGFRLHLEKLSISSFTDRYSQEMGTGVGVALRGLKEFLSAGGELILVLVFALLMLASRERFKRSTELILKQGASSLSDNPTLFVDSVAQLIQRFLLVRLGIALLVAGVDWIVLNIFGNSYTLLSGTILGLTTMIPVVGFFLGVIPPMILALASGTSLIKVGGLLLALASVSALEAHILSPKLLGQHLHISLFFIFLGLFVGERLWGAWGVFLSIPTLGIFRIILMSSPKGILWAQLLAGKELSEKPHSHSVKK